ncbi:MAG: 50S ribosomal protein L6 [Patescibacteria group bacterium]|jgi:large subunit ribosomal protein L6
MSRKANKPIPIPAGVTVIVHNGEIKVTGPKGELIERLHPVVNIVTDNKTVTITVPHPTDKSERALWGTFGALVRNMMTGVVTGYTKQLEISGVGYQFEVSGQKLTVKAGFSHPVVLEIPKAVTVKQTKNVIVLSSFDKQLLGQVAANVRKIRKPEPYKGKGIKYSTETIIRKQGKQAGSS